MGELADLQTSQAGQFQLNDWLGQQDNAATPKGLLPLILPTQEMRDFQRRYKFIPGERAIEIGERVGQVRFIVPAGEFWRPRTLMFRNGDSTTHVIEILASIYNGNTPSITTYRTTRTQIPTNSQRIVYGQTLDGGINSLAGYASLLPVILEPTDVFSLSDLTSATVATTQEWLFVYELVPGPATPLARGEDAEVTVT